MKAIKYFVLALLLSNHVWADELEAMKARLPKLVELKEKGAVGEQPDGLLGIIKDGPGVKAIVEAENKDRMNIYQKRAKDQGQDVNTLMKVLGEARLRQEKKGRFIQDASGNWSKVE